MTFLVAEPILTLVQMGEELAPERQKYIMKASEEELHQN